MSARYRMRKANRSATATGLALLLLAGWGQASLSGEERGALEARLSDIEEQLEKPNPDNELQPDQVEFPHPAGDENTYYLKVTLADGVELVSATLDGKVFLCIGNRKLKIPAGYSIDKYVDRIFDYFWDKPNHEMP